MRIFGYSLIAFFLLGLITSCGRKTQKAMDREAQLPYEVSADRPVLRKDIKIHSFYKTLEQNPPDEELVPLELKRSADREFHSILSDKKLSSLQRKINSELIYFHLLDLYLLPVYFNTGKKEVEEDILNCLVHLYDMQSVSELYLQARSLHAISQGGYSYPSLEEYLLDQINHQYAKSKDEKLEEARQLIQSLQ